MQKHHTIDYIEISVTDLERAKSFYAAAFGWSFKDYGPDYAGILGEGKEMGGLAKAAQVTAGGPLVVLYSEQLDATCQRVKEAGGRIETEAFDFPGGRRFHFKDPSGNVLAVWTASSAS